jgi:hypothetical protein
MAIYRESHEYILTLATLPCAVPTTFCALKVGWARYPLERRHPTLEVFSVFSCALEPVCSATSELWARQGQDLDRERAARATAEYQLEKLRTEVGNLRREIRGLKRQRAQLSTALVAAAAVAQSEFAGTEDTTD